MPCKEVWRVSDGVLTVVVDVFVVVLVGRIGAVERRAHFLSRRSLLQFNSDAIHSDINDATELVAVQRVRNPHLLAVVHLTG